MGWRDEIAKAVAAGTRRTDLPTRAYHGTGNVFPEFKQQPVDMILDRGLGTHVAKDPALASSFADTWIFPAGPKPGQDASVMFGKSPHVLPLRIPAEDKFLQVVQPEVGLNPKLFPLWQRVMHDEAAVDRMVAGSAYRQDPDLLARYLNQARAIPEREATPMARAMAAGERVPLRDNQFNLDEFIQNYRGVPYNQGDRELMTDLARRQWEGQGYKGLRYINTAPKEAGAPGVKDVTSYIIFNPADIRSEFARMDPAKIGSADLMSGVAGAAALPFMGAYAAQDRYEAPYGTR